MKKLLCIVLAMVVALSLVACGTYGTDTVEADTGHTYVEMDECTVDFLNRQRETDVTIYYNTYNTEESDYVLVQVYDGDSKNIISEQRGKAHHKGHDSMTGMVEFKINGADFDADSKGAQIWLYLCDENDNVLSSDAWEISFHNTDKPTKKPRQTPPADKNSPWLEITPLVEGTISRIPEYTCINYFYTVHNFKKALFLSCKATSIDDPNAVHYDYTFEIEGDGHGSMSADIWGEKLAGDYVIVEFKLLDQYGNILSERQINEKVVS